MDKLSFDEWLMTYCGITQEEYSKESKEERRAIRQQYEEDNEEEE